MSGKVLGILRAKRSVFSIPPYVHEFLLFTPERVVVVRQSAKLFPYPTAGAYANVSDMLVELLKTMKIEDVLRSDKHNFAISISEITKVELTKWVIPRGFFEMEVYPRGATGSDVDKLEKSHGWIELSIITSKKKYQWKDLEIPKKKPVEFEDYRNMLRPIFGDKLSVRLAREREEPFW
jgi:hypothetical protein